MTSWREEKRPTEAIERLDVSGLHDRIDQVQVLDVRERSEWEEGRLPGSVHVPYHDLGAIPAGIDPARPVAVICSSGQRGGVAASLLARMGAAHVINIVDGGVGTWRDRGWPIEEPNRHASGGSTMALVAIPFGLGIGLSLGMLGGGGSVLAVPVLVYILGQSVHGATSTSLVVVTAGAVVGGLSHGRAGRLCWQHALAFTGAPLPGVIVGTALGQAVSGTALIAAFAVIMLAAAAATCARPTATPPQLPPSSGRRAVRPCASHATSPPGC